MAWFLAIPLAFPGLSAQMTDNQQWFSVGLSQKVGDFRWSYEQNLRFRYGMYILDNSFSEFGGRYKINKFLDVKAKYRVGFKDPFLEGINWYHRFNLDLAVSKKWKPLKLEAEYRPRIQVRLRPEDGRIDQNWYVRNKLTFTYKWNKRLDFYSGGEIFHRLNKPGYPPFLNEWRFFSGVDFEIKKRQKIGLFYMLSQEVQQKDPWTNHVVGIGYSYRLKKWKLNKDKD